MAGTHDTPIWTDGGSWKTALPTESEIEEGIESEDLPELTDEQAADMAGMTPEEAWVYSLNNAISESSASTHRDCRR